MRRMFADPKTEERDMANTLVPFGWRLGRLENVWGDMDRVMGEMFGDSQPKVDWAPRLDLSETETHYEVLLDLPGVSSDEIEIEFKDGDLWITGKREEVQSDEKRSWHRVERYHGTFRRVIRLGDDVEAGDVEAEFADGVLTVTAPKAARARSHRIEIKP